MAARPARAAHGGECLLTTALLAVALLTVALLAVALLAVALLTVAPLTVALLTIKVASHSAFLLTLFNAVLRTETDGAW